MENYQQARWEEPLLFEKSSESREGHFLQSEPAASPDLPDDFLREDLDLPQLSEPEIVQYFTRLSQLNFGIDSGIYPLGSCTMKYNPRVNEKLASLDTVSNVHPDQPIETIQGSLELMYKLKKSLAEITGMDYFTLQPSAGAQGEFTAMKMVESYHEERGDEDRNEVLIPDSAHGTNPASARMAGFEIVEIPSTERGRVDLEALRHSVSDKTAGMMLTNPNTLGLFEDEIEEIVEIIHENGGLLFYDGANLNSILGKIRPGDMGFDLLHLNLHKTFSTPHGGGGPGGGPVGVKNELEDHLPIPVVERDEDDDRYYFDEEKENSIGKVQSFYGNFEVIVKAYTYIRMMGPDGLRDTAETAVLNANYIQKKVREMDGYNLEYGKDSYCKHETVISSSELESETGVSAGDLAKRLLDYGVHAPTMYFPIIVEEAMMIEPTETVSKADLDRYIEATEKVSKEARSQPEKVKSAPRRVAVGRLDDTKAARNPILSWKMYKEKKKDSGGE